MGDTWTEIRDRMLRVLRLVSMTYVFGRHMKVDTGMLNGSF
jgi:hypothetical protein